MGDGMTDGMPVASSWALASSTPNTPSDLWGAYAFSATDRWVAGTAGAIFHDTTGTWVSTDGSTTNTMFEFWGTAANDVWLVGRGCTVRRWAGASWAMETVPGCTGNKDYFSVGGSATSNVWFTGTAGVIVQFDGAYQDRSVGNEDYWDVVVTSATDVLVVGTSGSILQWNGSSLMPQTGAPSVTLAAIARVAPGEYWVVGGGGTIMHKTSLTAWTQVQSPTTVFLYGVLALGTSDVWAVGSGGVIIHYDGTMWSQVQSPTTQTLRTLAVIPGGGMLAVGDAGVVLLHP